jgi:hypothetical protein
LLTIDEPCLYHYDPKTKKNNHWSGGIAAHTAQKFPNEKPAENILASIFWDQDGMLLIDYLPKGRNINAEYYSSFLGQMKDILKQKQSGNITKFNLFLHDIAPAHRHLQPRRNWLTRASIFLVTHPIPRI